MARGKKTGGRDFTPGHKGYSGRPNHKVTEARRLNKERVLELLNEFSEKPFSELPSLIKNENTKSIEALVASVFYHGVKSGDHARLNFLLDRLIGKVKEEVDHTVKIDLHTQIVDIISKIEEPDDSSNNV